MSIEPQLLELLNSQSKRILEVEQTMEKLVELLQMYFQHHIPEIKYLKENEEN